MDQSRESLQTRIQAIKDQPLRELIRDITDSSWQWSRGGGSSKQPQERWVIVGGQAVRGTTENEKAPPQSGGQSNGQGQTLPTTGGPAGPAGPPGATFPTTWAWGAITGKPTTLAGYGIASTDTLFDSKYAPKTHTHLWADITDKPTTFAPSAHNHDSVYLNKSAGAIHGSGAYSSTYPTLAIGDGQYGMSSLGGELNLYSNSGTIAIRSRSGGADAVLLGTVWHSGNLTGTRNEHNHAGVYQPVGDYSVNGHTHGLLNILDRQSQYGTPNYDVGTAQNLRWKNYGSGHVIFDASQGTSPDGTVINNGTVDVPWVPTFPTLMGWNGINTYGVRVDRARNADWADSSDWNNIANKPSTFTPSEHNHTGVYQPVGDYSVNGHTHAWETIDSNPFYGYTGDEFAYSQFSRTVQGIANGDVPTTPNSGDAYCVGYNATGEFASHRGDIAIYNGLAWRYITVPQYTSVMSNYGYVYMKNGSQEWKLIYTDNATNIIDYRDGDYRKENGSFRGNLITRSLGCNLTEDYGLQIQTVDAVPVNASIMSRAGDMWLKKGFGIFGSPIVASKPIVTGSKSGNTALNSLLAALSSYGLVTDSTT